MSIFSTALAVTSFLTAPADTVLIGEEIRVQSTRSGRRIEEQATRVEVVEREEIEEKLLMRPGSIAMLLAETGGIFLQSTSAGLGGSAIRIQGMPGRYTLLLADGLPLYGGQPGGLGVLQIPPVDLESVEIIKGVASALYGGQALGGVVNLRARRPGDDPLAEFILNGTSRGGRDLVGYAETPLGGGWSGSVTAGLHQQGARDLDGSGWADLPAHDRGTFRARAFHEGEGGRRTMVTAGAMTEDRLGGMVSGVSSLPNQGFRDGVDTRRFDAGAHIRIPVTVSLGGASLAEIAFLDLRGSAMEGRFTRTFGAQSGVVTTRGERGVRFLEASVSGLKGAHTWVVGAALQDDELRHRDVPAPFFPLDFRHSVPGVFVQDEVRLPGRGVTIAGSLRVDRHDPFGTEVSPRISALWPGGEWAVRASVGRGFFGPTTLLDEVETAGLVGLRTPATLSAERGWGGALDVGAKWGAFEWNAVAFTSEVQNEAIVIPGEGAVGGFTLGNTPGQTEIRGAEFMVRARAADFTVTGSYLLVDAVRRGPQATSPVPRTPRHAAGLVGVWEEHDRGILGLELYYTGRQPLEGNPWRDEGRGWLHAGILGELRMDGWSAFVNLENLLGVRQTRWDSLLRPAPDPLGLPVTEAWAPLEGFTLNAGVRIRLGGGPEEHDHH
jgi:iron complex outermembrane receptor protein